MTHDTLMALCDAVTSYGIGTVGRTQARAALSAAISEVLAERDALSHFKNQMVSAIDNQSLSAFIEKHGKPVPLMQKIESLKAERDALVSACGQYEAALHAAFPTGAHGHAFEHWNDARKLLNEREAMKGTPT